MNKVQEEPLFDLLNEIDLEKNRRKKMHKRNIMNFINRRIFDFYNKEIQKVNFKIDKTNVDDSYCSMTAYKMVSNMFLRIHLRKAN